METKYEDLGKPEVSEFIDDVILTHAEKLLIFYAKEYQERPKELMNSFLKYDSIKMASTLVIYYARKTGMLEELKGKNFSEWVNKQNLEERWRGVLNKFLIILWAVNYEPNKK